MRAAAATAAAAENGHRGETAVRRVLDGKQVKDPVTRASHPRLAFFPTQLGWLRDQSRMELISHASRSHHDLILHQNLTTQT